LFASNTAKRAVEAIHRLGIRVSYETATRALHGNSDASHVKLIQLVKTSRFFITFDNMNFYQNVRDQRQHNRGHQVNYTAGCMCIMDCCNEHSNKPTVNCGCGSLPGDSIDHSLARQLSYSDFDLTGPASNYLKEVNVHLFGTTLQRYFGWTMFKQVDLLTKHPKYQIANSPLSELRVKQSRAIIYTLKTLDLDESSISGTTRF